MKRKRFLEIALASPIVYYLSSAIKLISDNVRAIIVRAKESRFGIPTPFLGVNPNDLKLSSKDTAGNLSTFYYKGLQKVGPSFHYHKYQDEVFYVINGQYIFQLGQEKQILNTGDLIFLPRNIPHTWIQLSEAGEMFYFLQPAGKMEEFFLKMTELGANSTKEQRAQIGLDSGIFNVGPGLKLTDEHIYVDRFSEGFIVKSHETRLGDKVLLGGVSPNDLKVSGKDTGSELSIFEYTGKEKGGPPLHIHLYQDETFYILEGEYLFQCGEDKTLMTEGDMIFLPRGLPHTWAQLTENGKLLYFFQPAGKMESFFKTTGNQKEALSPEEGMKLWEDHEMKIVGPPLKY
ncbi:MAG: cupin domain-containing protein [Saprospiraceae bacterium]|nr:cupin domain-containing protein [Saprospiraceae bacterium]